MRHNLLSVFKNMVLTILAILFVSCSQGNVKNAGLESAIVKRQYVIPANDSGLFALLNLDYPGMESVKKYVRAGDYSGAKNAYLQFRREESKPKWNIDPSDKPLKATDKDAADADLVVKHIVRASRNAPEAFLGDDINWEYNPVDPGEPSFTKEWTWGINRMYSWDFLGDAYWKTLNEKYATEWVEQMTDWVEDNPVQLDADPGSTLTWRTIESGIRMARSWMNAYYYFLNSPSFTSEAHAVFVKGIIEHGEKLDKTQVDFPGRTGNWVTMESNGLGTIGILFPELKMSERYKAIAFQRLDGELDKQVYPDGAEIELTPHYHQVSLYNFMRMSKLAIKNDISLPDGYISKMKKMFEFNLYMMDPSGYVPPFNDAGRESIVTSKYEVSGLMEAYDIWKDEKFLFGATLGKKGVKPEYDSYYFNWAGYYVMRSGWTQNDNCLYFDAGPLGSGHEHEDMLTLYLYSRGKILLTEGSYTYDKSEWRKFAISTPAHNTIIVDGKEQHRADIPGSRVTKEPLKNPWISNFLFDYGSGTYSSGYQESRYIPVQYKPIEFTGPRDTSVSHTRNVIFLKPYYYVVVDFLDGKGKHTFESHFNLDAPDVKVDKKRMYVHTMRTDSVQLGLFPMDIDNLGLKIVKGQTNPILGWLPMQKKPIPTVVFTKIEEAPATFSTFIYPWFISEPQISCTAIKASDKDSWAKKIITPHESLAVVINRENEGKPSATVTGVTGQFTSDAKVIVVRKPVNQEKEFIGLTEFREYRDDLLDFKLPLASSLILIRCGKNSNLIFNPTGNDISVIFSSPLKKTYTIRTNGYISVTSSGIEEKNEPVKLF